MARGKRHGPEQIVNVLRQIEVAIANGEDDTGSVQGSRICGTDLLPLAQGVWRSEVGPGEAVKRAGAGEL
jgi:hypothetical protein